MDCTLVVYTPAIPQDSIILNYFKNNGYDLYKRSEVLGFITESSFTIGVAGTHGKTTTSSIVAHVLTESKVGCNAFLGGIATNYNTNLLIDAKSKNTVVEADEFDRSFLTLVPNIAIVTSTDADHLDIYGAHSELLQSFQLFVDKINPSGTLILRAGLELNFENTLTYGIDSSADYNAHNLYVDNGNYKFDVQTPNGLYQGVVIGLPGRHNIENALAAIAVGELMNVSKENIIAGLASFQGVKRRFEKIIDTQELVYIDDYAHHPKELEMCIGSVKELYPNRKVTGIFQPHLFTRTRDFADDFAKSLSMLNELLLLDIYPARELPIEGVTSEMLLAKVNLKAKEIVSISEVVERLETKDLDILLTLGAGDIGTIVQPIKNAFSI
jgi:UDP-N-acetylmuramate--alanine ligase